MRSSVKPPGSIAGMTRYPFEVSFAELVQDIDHYVDTVFSSLESEFMVMPKGSGFIQYPTFENAYESLKRATDGFRLLEPDTIIAAAVEQPLVLIVLRTILAVTPSEWAYLASLHTGTVISQTFARTLGRRIRMAPDKALHLSSLSEERVRAMVATACTMIAAGAPPVDDSRLHRLSRADTQDGIQSLVSAAIMGVPYAMLLYERLLGRPFAGHRDSVSELVGGSLEAAVEEVLASAGVSYRKTKRAERVQGFDQAPDFIIPSEYNPQVVIEAKITEDDGTARDKVTRIQHLGELSTAGQESGDPRFEVIACIGGRGFAVRREDMRKMLLATRGKVFTVKSLDYLVQCSRLREFARPEAAC